MSAGTSFLLGSAKPWNSQPLNCGQSRSAFISKPHFACPHASFSRRLSSAGKLASPRMLSKVLAVRTFSGPRKKRFLSGFISFQLGSSGLVRTLPNHGRKSLTVGSARPFVHLETEWTPVVKGCIIQGGELYKLMLVLSHIFSDVTSSNVLYSVTLLSTILGLSGSFYAFASRGNGPIRQNPLESERISETEQYEILDGWLNLSQATPFNRFVTARCPSLAPSVGRSNRKDAEAEFKVESKLPEYQRLCLHAHDGGTVALDWPSHLDLEENKELENVLLIIPGSTEGSEEKGIRKFTRLAEQRGYFPVILNPRGCGGSPLTTPRIFSAADSDDVRILSHYIAKRRPWATIMGVGWGFGANMLSKYLGEDAYASPLTAAVCVDNPYKLEKVTQSSTGSRWSELDQTLSSGLVKILDANKKLFLGDSKGFDVSGGLAATSLSEFEAAISRVAHGYESLQEFYQGASSEATLERVQIPLLYIEHVQDYIGHQISLSQMVLEKNPYIMLLVSPANTECFEDSLKTPNFPGVASEWSHGIALEWLAAVEVALLKGRHPLSNVVDFTVKPSKEWSPVGSQITSTATANNASEQVTSTVDVAETYSVGASEIIDVTGDISDPEQLKLRSQGPPTKSSVEASEHRAHGNDCVSPYDHAVIAEGTGDASKHRMGDADEQYSQEEQRKVERGSSSGAEEKDSAEDVERGQVQLAAENVMKVLDVTMPGTLLAEQKQQVLEAVGRGETLVGALQEAVPEDVRGKIAGAVSAAVQAKGISLKTAGFGEQIPAPKIPAGLSQSLRDKLAGLSGSAGDSPPNQSPHNDSEMQVSDVGKKVENVAHSESTVHDSSESSAEKNSSAKDSSGGGKSNADLNTDRQAQADTFEDHSDGSGTAGTSSDDSKKSDDVKSVAEGAQPTAAGSGPSQATRTNADDTKNDASVPHTEQASHEIPEHIAKQTQEAKANLDDQRVDDSGTSEGTERRDASEHKDEPSKQEPSPNDNSRQSLETSDSKATEVPHPSDADQQKSQTDVTAVENPVPGPVPPQTSARDQVPPVPSVGQALQALTGFDDATQMAVTNVFGVVENVLDQLEKDNPPAEGSSTVAEKKGREEGIKRGTSRSGNAHETGDSDSVDDPEKDILEPDEEHDKEVDSATRGMVKVKPVTSNASHAGDHLQLASKKIQNGIRSSVDQSGRSQVDQGRKKEGNEEFEGRHRELGDGSTPRSEGAAEISLFADKGEQRFFKRPDSRLVDIDSTQNEFLGDDNDYPHHLERSLSPLDKRRSQAQTVAGIRDMSHSPAYPGHGNERRLSALAAEIDKEDQESLSEENITRDADAKDKNSGGEDQNVVRDIVVNALKLEVVRRLGGAGLDALGLDLEEEVSKVAHAVSEAVKQGQERILDFASERDEGSEGSEEAASSQSDSSGKLGILNGSSIVRTLGVVLGGTSTLGNLIPLGVLVGVVLAALGALFLIVTDDQNEEKTAIASLTSSSKSVKRNSSTSEFDELASESSVGHVPKNNDRLDHKRGGRDSPYSKMSSEENNARVEDGTAHSDTENDEVDDSSKDEGVTHGKLVGALTAAMGATAAVASQSAANTSSHSENVHSSDSVKTDGRKAQGVHDSADGDGIPKFVPEIAEKAISMVSPVVPKKEDGEVDQDRLVAMLAEIGQKGGILTLVGKAALLWGGLRGAMSLADRLLGFLRIKDRPLQQRLLGFVGMAILLWTPVLVPLLPTLLQQWATKSPNGVADAAAGVGLYGAVFILITIWGKRIRGYDRPLVAYGLELLSRAKLRIVAVGLAIGVNLVAAYYGSNWALGFINFSWNSVLVENSSFPGPAPTAILTFWKLFSLIGQSVSMALVVAIVEELLFRAWLQEEIAVDLGYDAAILLSALAFAVVHWSPSATVGLWFLSVALAGARSRMDGDLSLSIGIHAGIVAAFSVVNVGGLAYYLPAAPAWLTGAHAGNPLAGALGTAMVAALAIVLYPRKQELPRAEDDDYDNSDDS